MGRSRQHKWSWLQALLLLMSGVMLTSCGAPKLPQLSLAIADWPGYEYFYLAAHQRLDRKAGFELSVVQFSSLEDERRAYVRGDVEAIATTLPDAVAICRQAPARCPVIVLVLDQSDGADQLIASQSVRSMASLKGKVLGIEKSDLGEYMAIRALQKAGMVIGDVRLVYGGPRNLVDRLVAGNLDAIVSYPPHIDYLGKSQDWQVLFSSRDIPGEIVDVLAVSPALFRDRLLVDQLIQSWWLARDYALAQPQQATTLMAKRQGVTPAQFMAFQNWINYPGREAQAQLLAAEGPVQQTLRRLVQNSRSFKSGAVSPLLPTVSVPARP